MTKRIDGPLLRERLKAAASRAYEQAFIGELSRPTGSEDGPLGKLIVTPGSADEWRKLQIKRCEWDWREGHITAYECARRTFNLRQEMQG